MRCILKCLWWLHHKNVPCMKQIWLSLTIIAIQLPPDTSNAKLNNALHLFCQICIKRNNVGCLCALICSLCIVPWRAERAVPPTCHTHRRTGLAGNCGGESLLGSLLGGWIGLWVGRKQLCLARIHVRTLKHSPSMSNLLIDVMQEK